MKKGKMKKHNKSNSKKRKSNSRKVKMMKGLNNPCMTVIQSPNGLEANTVLNKLADEIEPIYGNKNWNFRFEIGMDGIWEYIIETPKYNRALVLRKSYQYNGYTEVFGYFTSFCNPSQPFEDVLVCVKNSDLKNAIITTMEKMTV
jgi:hypothetical protein